MLQHSNKTLICLILDCSTTTIRVRFSITNLKQLIFLIMHGAVGASCHVRICLPHKDIKSKQMLLLPIV